MGDTERVIALLEEILGELRSFNRSVPLLDELVEREEALRTVKTRSEEMKDGAAKSWQRFRQRRSEGAYPALATKKEKLGE